MVKIWETNTSGFNHKLGSLIPFSELDTISLHNIVGRVRSTLKRTVQLAKYQILFKIVTISYIARSIDRTGEISVK